MFFLFVFFFSIVRVWNKVTSFILDDDMKNADRAKVVVEENARKLRKEREATGVSFVPRYFALSGERWVHTDAAVDLSNVFEPGLHSITNGNATADDTEASTLANKTMTEISDSEDRSYL